MQISIIKEENSNEQRVASTPDSINTFSEIRCRILIEKGAGDLSGYSDELYESVGAKIVIVLNVFKSDICLCVRMPNQDDINQ